MSAATDRTRDEAQARSNGCPYCQGWGLAYVFDRDYDGRAVALRDAVRRGEAVRRPVIMRGVAHCLCPLGRWTRGRLEGELLRRIPDLAEVLAGRTRWTTHDPTREEAGRW